MESRLSATLVTLGVLACLSASALVQERFKPRDRRGYAVVAPPPDAETSQPVPAAPAPKALPDSIIYPRSGQSATQTEADRQECNRWATTQPSAMTEAQVFQRAVAACMDGRGYTVR